MRDIVWTDYLQYRAALRGYDLNVWEQIVRYSDDRYFDTETLRTVVVGRHDKDLVLIPYDLSDETITPATVHATTLQQVRFRLQTGRFTYE
jgi:hypothetical protein